MKRKILKLIEKNARMTNAEIATIIGVGEDEVRKEISELEASGVIKAYKGVINHELVDTDLVSAIIELKVTPKAELGLECREPKGAFYAFPSIKSTKMSSEEFCERLLRSKSVALVPGTAFGESGEGFVRASYCYSISHIKEVLRRIKEFLQEL